MRNQVPKTKRSFGLMLTQRPALRSNRMCLDWESERETIEHAHEGLALNRFCGFPQFHGLLMSRHPRLMLAGSQKSPCLQASLWTRQVQHCMACHQLWQFKGSMLALAIITLELERLTPDWFSVFTDLLRKAQVRTHR